MFHAPSGQGRGARSAGVNRLQGRKEQESRGLRWAPTRTVWPFVNWWPPRSRTRNRERAGALSKEDTVSSIFYIIGVVVVVLAIINFVA